jgi:class 3 adenylate cyclase/tetratricopeptide (TPR) repeat protein
MQCPNCSFQNPDDAKFCQNCGQPLPRPCPNCGTPNGPEAKFCKNCGTKLGPSSPPAQGTSNLSVASAFQDPRHARLAASAPAQLADKIRAAAQLAGERRIVTALFADVVGSTALAEQMDPEEWTVVMNRAFDVLVPAIYQYEGTIARLMGDALLAFFGAPVAHEDDPIRAVHAGLDLLAAADQYAEEVRRRRGIDFAVRVGLNTGPVVVGQVGSNLVYEYTAMGDAINLAARIQSAARPMSLLITENTYRFVAPAFDCQDMGEIAIKGKREPVRAYEVIGPKARPGSLRGVAGLQSAMVGREAELKALMELCAAASAGLGRGALIIGEAGLGKSRLIDEWKANVANSAIYAGKQTWLEGNCLSYGQSIAYHLVKELLRSFLGVAASAGEAEVRQALQARCEELLGEDEAADVFSFLAHLLSLQLSGAARDRVSALDPQALQAQYLASLRKLLRTLAERQPLLLVLEDIHWADPSSVELLAKLLPLSAGAPVVFCAATRPDREAPGWRLVSAMREAMGAGLTEINLHALAETESRQLVANLLEIEALPEEVRRTILDKAEGNPFFVEEVIRMLIDQGAIIRRERGWAARAEVETSKLPDTVQGLLLARIDRLPDEAKSTIRVASVIGRQFSLNVLEHVLERLQWVDGTGSGGGSPSSLRNSLNLLESMGLLTIVQVQPELEYNFRHEMVHEVVYHSLVRRDRQALHLATGEALESLYADRLDEFAPTLGLHFEEGNDEDRAVRYLSVAGDNAAGQYANQEARMFYSRAIRILVEKPALDEEQTQQLIHLYLSRGRALELMGRYEQALDNYLDMEKQAQQRQDQKMALASLMARTIVYSTPTPVIDPAAAEASATRALDLAQSLGDQAAEAKVHWALMLRSFFENMPEEARRHGDRSLALARQLNLREQLAYTLSDLANFVYMAQGEFERGIEALQEAEVLWRELGNLPLLSNALVYMGFINYFAGRFELALQETDEAYRISQSIDNYWGEAFSRGVSALTLLELADGSQVNSRLEEAARLIDQSGFAALKPITQELRAKMHDELGAIETAYQYALGAVKEAENEFQFWLPMSLGALASTLIAKGELEPAGQVVERAEEIARQTGMFIDIAFSTMPAAELALARGDFQAALESAETLLGVARETDAQTFLPHGLYDKGQAMLAMGRTDEAEEALQEANQWAERLGSRRVWWKCLASLAEIAAERGDEAQAEAYRGQARDIIDFIAEHTGSAELKESFLSLPEVQKLYP